jgi:hypothetical protein
MLEDLPQLDEIESKYAHPSDGDTYKKFIRNSGYTTPTESGMGVNSPVLPPKMPSMQRPPAYTDNMTRPFRNMPPEMSPSYGTPIATYSPYVEENITEHFKHGDNLSCISVSRHATNCPVCSRLYNNNLNSVLLVIVVMQIIIVMMLLRQMNLV